MIKKNKIVLLACIAFIAISAIAASLFLSFSNKPDSEAEPAYGIGTQYILRDYNGFVSVFLPYSESPHMVTATLTDSLPKADRDALYAGIPIYSQAELTALLEDYCS